MSYTYHHVHYCKTLFIRRILISRFPYVKICYILILRIFRLILLSTLFPASFGASKNVIMEIFSVLLFTLYNTKNIAYITEELTF